MSCLRAAAPTVLLRSRTSSPICHPVSSHSPSSHRLFARHGTCSSSCRSLLILQLKVRTFTPHALASWSDMQVGKVEEPDLAMDGEVYQKTLRLVECSMFAAITGLAYFLSNSLSIENYFGCFFPFPIVLSSMRWGVAAGRKTMVATAMLLLTLAGPVKACTYLLMHGLLGLAMGAMWRLRASWLLSVFLCTAVRALGAVGYVLLTSFLIRENILSLITINVHASVSYILFSVGVNSIPSMSLIYAIFGILLILNCGFFVFLLHILYAVFLNRLGMKANLSLPKWLAAAI